MAAAYARPELLATADWVAQNVSRAGIRIVDCRWRPDGTANRLHAAGHIPSAVHLNWSVDLVDADDPTPYQLAGPDQVAAALAREGIGDGMTAVLYDDTASLYATHIWWSLVAYGFESVRVLDGGWQAWLTSGRPISTSHPRSDPATFTPRADPRRRLSTEDVRAILGGAGVQIIDARSPADHAGQQGSSLRLGHIPGAVNLPAVLLTEPETGRFLPSQALDRLMDEAGVDSSRRIVVYHTTGVGATKLAFALELLGFGDVAVYDAGWTEWGSQLELPVER